MFDTPESTLFACLLTGHVRVVFGEYLEDARMRSILQNAGIKSFALPRMNKELFYTPAGERNARLLRESFLHPSRATTAYLQSHLLGYPEEYIKKMYADFNKAGDYEKEKHVAEIWIEARTRQAPAQQLRYKKTKEW